MKLTTWDLYDFSICPKKYVEAKINRDIDSTIRNSIKQIVLLKALGRESRWTVKGITALWDNIFWRGKEVNQDTINSSTRGIVSLRKIYKIIPSGLTAHPASTLVRQIDGGITLTSSADFLLVGEKKIEIWVFADMSPIQLNRSILPSAERYVLEGSLRAPSLFYIPKGGSKKKLSRKRIEVIAYYGSEQGMSPRSYRVIAREDGKAVRYLAEGIRRGLHFPTVGDHCQKCKVVC